MDRQTGELYDNYDNAVSELQNEGLNELEAKDRLISLKRTEFEKLKKMTLDERKGWARKNKR